MVQHKPSRRSFLGTTAMVLVGTTGCIGGGGGQISSVEMEEDIIVNLQEDHNVDRLQLISESGEEVSTAHVGQETRVSLTTIFDTSFNNALSLGTYTVVAVNSEDSQVGETQINYNPEVGLSDVSVDTETGHVEFSVQNEGEGPFYLRTANTEYVEEGQMEFEVPAYNGEPNTRTESLRFPQRENNNIAAGISRGGIIVKDSLEYNTSEVDNYAPLHRRYDASTSPDNELTEAPSSSETEATSVIRLTIGTLPQEVSTAFDIEMSFSGIDGEIDESSHISGGAFRSEHNTYELIGYPQEAEVVSVEKVGSGEDYFPY